MVRRCALVFDIWDKENPLLKKAYEQDNYIIKTYNNNSPYMVVYFASNGLYYPDTEECFKKTVLEGNRFEWLNARRMNAGKEIYLRDIFKTHYVLGINSRISSMYDLIEFIKKESQGYRLITVGNSAGGYAAAVVGTALQADMVFDFSGQNEILDYTNDPTSPIMHLQSTSAARFYDLREMWSTQEIPYVFYFYSANNEGDKRSWEQIEQFLTSDRLFPFAFNTNTHEETMFNFNLPTVLNMERGELIELSRRFTGSKISRLEFALSTMGIVETCRAIVRKVLKKLKRR